MKSKQTAVEIIRILGTAIVLGIVGSFILSALRVPIPDWIGHSVSAALGGLTGLLAKTESDKGTEEAPAPVTITNTAQNPVPTEDV